MHQETISDKQAIMLVMLFIIGTAIVFIPGFEAGKDVWLAVIFSVVMILPFIFMYARLLFLFPGKGLFDILQSVFGKWLGKGLGILYIWFALHLSSLIIRNFGDFVSTVGLRETPSIVSMIGIGLLCAWGVKQGIEVLGRWVEFFLPLLIVIVFGAIFLLMPEMDMNNVRPVLYDGIRPVARGTFSIFSFPFGETIMFTMVFHALKTRQSCYKVYITGVCLTGIVGTLISLTVVLVLGVSGYLNAYFPTYAMVSKLNVGGFLQRVEVIVAVVFLLGGFIKASICLIGASQGVAKVFGLKDYRFIVIPVVLLVLNLAYFHYEDVREMYRWTFAIWPYYAFAFQAIIPVLIWIFAEMAIRSRKKRDG
ncbi:MAG: endospore germination permease [Firmicutes bacterium]|nr:endospore germination permease [Bacillota bacterium]